MKKTRTVEKFASCQSLEVDIIAKREDVFTTIVKDATRYATGLFWRAGNNERAQMSSISNSISAEPALKKGRPVGGRRAIAPPLH